MEKQYLDRLETIVHEAHEICDNIMLYEAICMDEKELRQCLTRYKVLDKEKQDKYLELARRYDKETR